MTKQAQTALAHLTATQTTYRHVELSALYHATCSDLTIGQYHDMIRGLVKAGQVKLHPFTGAAYQLQDEEYAMVSGQEIKYYAERI